MDRQIVITKIVTGQVGLDSKNWLRMFWKRANGRKIYSDIVHISNVNYEQGKPVLSGTALKVFGQNI